MELAALAERQHGVVALWQVVALGLEKRAVMHRVAAGRLHRVFRGVYAVGHKRLIKRGWWMAAVLACGEGALLSHLSGAELLNLRQSGNIIDVTSPTRSRHGLHGIRLHQPRFIAPEHRTIVDGIPVTTVPRLLADLAGTLDATGLKRVWHEADRQGILDVEAVKPLASQPRRGIRNLRALIEAAEDTPDTKTEFEHRFHDLICANPDIPQPVYNVALHGYVVDAAWLTRGLVVELHSRAYHWHRTEEDADRAGDLLAYGYRTYAVTWKALTRTPDLVAYRIRQMLR
jgi:hypothetical protein